MRAALFDIDGTLVDSNYLHIEAWSAAFADLELDVDAWRIHRAIGMDSARLLETLLGEGAAKFGDEASRLHTKHYAVLAPRLKRFDGVAELVGLLRRRGVAIVLATSAPDDELELLRRVIGLDEEIDAVTSSEEVETTKPAPDIVTVALTKAGVGAGDAVFICDSVWDLEAAGKLGVQGIGLLSGGTPAAHMREAGATYVYDDVAALLVAVERGEIAMLAAPG
ncbi:MAG: HAD family hydrolase [Burkholderiaceae bacterium]|nr:HAD family hydrolase [Microbacteriaceae bacterium]